MTVKQFLAGPIGTNCYLLINEKTKEAVIVDPASCPDYMMNYIKIINFIYFFNFF